MSTGRRGERRGRSSNLRWRRSHALRFGSLERTSAWEEQGCCLLCATNLSRRLCGPTSRFHLSHPRHGLGPCPPPFVSSTNCHPTPRSTTGRERSGPTFDTYVADAQRTTAWGWQSDNEPRSTFSWEPAPTVSKSRARRAPRIGVAFSRVPGRLFVVSVSPRFYSASCAVAAAAAAAAIRVPTYRSPETIGACAVDFTILPCPING